MSMKGTMQASVAPMAPPASLEFNQIKVTKQEKAADMGEVAEDLDFRTMVQNSNAETLRDRAAKKSGDLSGAKTDEEFYRALNDRNNPSRTPKNTLGKDDFLKLFVAQMQNQDPLNPSDASQMAAQMAQFNSLEQMMNVNTTLNSLLKAQDQGRTVQMINYVGKEVDVGTGILKYDKTKLTKASFEIEQPLPSASLEVRDSSGQVIGTQELGSLMPGEHNVKWNGRLKDGSEALPGLYNFQVVGKTSEGQDLTVPIKSKVKVMGIDLKDEGGSFYTELGKIQMKDVTSVGLQAAEEAKILSANSTTLGTAEGDQPSKPLEEGLENAKTSKELTLPKKGVTGDRVKTDGIKGGDTDPAAADPGDLPPGLMEAAQKMLNEPTKGSPQRNPDKTSGSTSQKPMINNNDSGIPVTMAGGER
ncbi:MAG: flagellar hook assembly protein FlgD [Proteobacteria bacterium]|nr:flagellar hook assembly protein FlgD [Pseudomonadota bacterium]